jgi:hypothetical protein
MKQFSHWSTGEARKLTNRQNLNCIKLVLHKISLDQVIRTDVGGFPDQMSGNSYRKRLFYVRVDGTNPHLLRQLTTGAKAEDPALGWVFVGIQLGSGCATAAQHPDALREFLKLSCSIF